MAEPKLTVNPKWEEATIELSPENIRADAFVRPSVANREAINALYEGLPPYTEEQLKNA